jgi:G:T/U-mismatch repair DNA glycosylase
LSDRASKQELFHALGIAVGDIIRSCRRLNNSNLDSNLVDKEYNFEVIRRIIDENEISKVMFTSAGVRKEFASAFRALWLAQIRSTFVVLPSPSPRFAMPLSEKIEAYRAIFPAARALLPASVDRVRHRLKRSQRRT